MESFKERLKEMKTRGEISTEQFEKIRFDNKLLSEVYDASVTLGDNFEAEHVYDIIGRINQQHESDKKSQLLMSKGKNKINTIS